MIAVTFLSFPLGAGGSGFIASAPVIAFFFFLPESIRFLVTRGTHPDEVARLMNRPTRSRRFTGTETYAIEEQPRTVFSVWHLLAERWAINAVMILGSSLGAGGSGFIASAPVIAFFFFLPESIRSKSRQLVITFLWR